MNARLFIAVKSQSLPLDLETCIDGEKYLLSNKSAGTTNANSGLFLGDIIDLHGRGDVRGVKGIRM